METKVYDIYESYTKQYIAEFGSQTIVLFQCGSFFEVYSIDDGLVDIRAICELLNIQWTRKNKSIIEVSRDNCLMAGFPLHALSKFVGILVKANYTVVVIEQVTPPPRPKRKVTNIYSPGMDPNATSCPDAQTIVCVYSERGRGESYILGCAVLDTTTGACKVYELPATTQDPSLALDECYRILRLETPREILLIGDEFSTDGFLPSGVAIHRRWEAFNQETRRLAYQTQLLQKVFPDTGILSVLEYLGLERLPFATIAFVSILQFAFQHNDTILERLSKPTLVEPSAELVLSYNCAKHLDVIGTSNASLLGTLNRCVTAMGKRLFREWLLHPSADPTIFTERHTKIANFTPHYDTVRAHFRQVYDLERLARRVVLGTLHPCELCQLATTIEAATNAMIYLELPVNNTILEFINSQINLELAVKFNIDGLSENIFKVNDQTQSLQADVSTLENVFTQIVDQLNKLIGVDGAFKLEFGATEGYSISITTKRYTDYASKFKSYTTSTPAGMFAMSDCMTKSPPKTATVKLLHPVLKTLNTQLEAARELLVTELRLAWKTFLTEFSSLHYIHLKTLAVWIAETDVYCCNAKNAAEFGYVKPELTPGKSFVKATSLRHPIIERINETTPYTPNDVDIGGTCPHQGILLYGTNMVGKSAYMKSIGLAVLMAQAGMFVAAEVFEWAPYTHIFTRIPSGDDISRGLSTFAVEITELRNILRRANATSLVIGDEVASGTESVSAVAIVGAGISELYDAGSSFVFATHLHALPKLNGIKSLERLGIFHMEVNYDPQTRKLVFSRKLKPGQGNALYGLEVCKALDLSDKFLRLSNTFRQELLGISSDIVQPKRSRYNKNHYVDVCELCKQPATEVHHRVPQQKADSNGLIAKRFHKNTKHNLMNVCEACHDKIHATKN